MIEVSEDEKQEIVFLCAEFLGKPWIRLKNSQIACERFSAGLANKTFHVWIKDENGYEISDCHNVIVQIYNSGIFGKEIKNKFNGEAAEIVVRQKLYELGMAPQILGVFSGGRIEKFIPSRAANVDDTKSIDLCKEVMRKLAYYHTLLMPISKKPNLVKKITSAAVQSSVPYDYAEKYPNEVYECELLINFPFEEEYNWMRQILPIVGYKVVLSHNDLKPGNILLKESTETGEDKIMFVDFEASTYFYRAYDLAYFYEMKRIRPEIQNERITVIIEEDDNELMDELLQEYLNEYQRLNPNEFDPKYDNLKRFRMEVEFFNLVYDFLLIGIMKYILFESLISLSLNLVGKRASGYKHKKQSLIQKYGDPINWK